MNLRSHSTQAYMYEMRPAHLYLAAPGCLLAAACLPAAQCRRPPCPTVTIMAVTLAVLVELTAAGSSVAATSSNFSWVAGLGHHRAIITLPPSTVQGAAAWATVPWQRRAVPNATTTAAVLTVASTGAVVANAVRAPAGPGISDSEALTFIFMPMAEGAAPAPPGPPTPPGADGFVRNHGTASRSIVTSCSGAMAGCECWKAVDGKMLFNDGGGAAEGWDSQTQDGVGWLEMDLGSVPPTPVTKFGVYSVSQADDRRWFPVHNPRGVSRPFSSWDRSILTEIYLCHACSCQEILRAETAGKVALLGRASPRAPWTVLLNTTVTPNAQTGTSVLSGWPPQHGHVRYFRFEIWSRGKSDPSHSYIKEVQFGEPAVSILGSVHIG
eukprot:COSAG01_NODE_5582_length_4168_cov_2.695257_1_plen_382_part_00